ncbi:MAG: hypothetical protein RBQ97_10440, partial [Acholeplasma sp.]|nr:hypothetical protein [Acholeplasma sp.]
MRKIIGFLVLAFSVLTSTSNSNDNLDMREAVSKRDVIINNISKPFTYAEIEEIVMLKAYDEVFGDLTEKIVLVNNQYAGNETVIGFFELEYEVTNDYGVKTTYVLIVYNVDFEKPEIIGNNDPTMISYKEDFNLDNIIKLFKVVDNSSQDITLTVIRNTYQINTIGYFEVELEAKDGSGNVTTIIHSIHVFDNIQPEIIDEHLRHETNGDEIDDTFLLQGLSAYDEIDGNLTKQITIKSKTFLSSDKMRVNYEVMDSSSNTVQYYRDYIITSNKEKLVGTSVVKANIGAFLKIEGVINQVIKELSLDTHQYAVIK